MWPFAAAYPERRIDDVNGQTFDYVVVGGGTAGCVVASRLSEDPAVSVLLVERGPVRDGALSLSRVPLLSQNYAFPWSVAVTDRFSEPLAAYDGRRMQLVSGEGLGGTTRINGMLLTRGVAAGYDQWAADEQAGGFGLDGWAWRDVEPYFRRIESALDAADKPYRGHDGPVVIRQTPLRYDFYPFIAKACRAIGLPVEDDCNAPTASAQGFFRLDAAVYPDGTRVSAHRAYLDKPLALARRGHLVVCTETLASRLQLDDNVDSARVTGIVLQDARTGRQARVTVRREAVVCGGAFRSPQLLMLSGLGPGADLAAAGVCCIRDLPAVGRHLADHMAIPLMVELPVHDTAHRLLRQPLLFGARSALQHALFGTGILSMPTNAASIFARTSALDEATYTVAASVTGHDTAPPDVEIMLNPVNCINLDLPHTAPIRRRAFLTLYTTLVQACTDGRLALPSDTAVATDPSAHMRVTYPGLGADADPVAQDDPDVGGWAVLRKAVRLAMRIADGFVTQSGYPHTPAALVFAPGMDADALAHVTRGRPGERSPDAAASPSATTSTPTPPTLLGPVATSWQTVTDAEIDAYARATCQSSLHFTSTCRMALTAATGVVDAQLRVHGVANLRVADASVLPKIPSAHTMAAVLMVGERCAHMVRADWADRR